MDLKTNDRTPGLIQATAITSRSAIACGYLEWDADHPHPEIQRAVLLSLTMPIGGSPAIEPISTPVHEHP